MARDGHTRTIGTPRGRKVALWLLVAAVAYGVIYVGQDGVDRFWERGPWVTRTAEQSPEGGALGTSGGAAPGADNTAGPPAVSPPPVVQDAQAALTGDDEWQDLVGREITLTIPMGPHVNDVAFWTEDGGPPLLVVLARDRRDGATRQRGEPNAADLSSTAGQAAISGTVQRLPHAEAMYSWRLTNHDAAELSRRPIYLHVTEVKPAGEDLPQ